jgi:hypothetical protein
MNYQIWEINPGKNVCILGSLQNVENDFQLRRGISRAEEWPDNACYFMDKERKEDIRLEDCLDNVGRLLVISSRLKALLDKENLKNNEFLPVTVFNHKNQAVKEPYYILNQVQLQDVIDLDRSEYKRNRINPDIFSVVKKLLVDEGKIEQGVALFRMQYFPGIPIVRRDLADKISAAGITGVEFTEVDKFRGA